MTKDKMIKLIEGLASAGYEITEIYNFDDNFPRFLLRQLKKTNKTAQNKKMIKLIEIFFSIGYKISKYNIFRKLFLCEIKIELRLLE
jgi:hypothetical protein